MDYFVVFDERAMFDEDAATVLSVADSMAEAEADLEFFGFPGVIRTPDDELIYYNPKSGS